MSVYLKEIRLTSSCIPPVNTVPHNDQTKSLGGKRWGSELRVKPFIKMGGEMSYFNASFTVVGKVTRQGP